MAALYRRRRSSSFLFFSFFLLFLFTVGGGLFWIDRIFAATLLKIAEVEVVHLATEIIYRSVQDEVLSGNLQYQDFVQVHKDDRGRVVFFQANTAKVNSVAARIALSVQESLRQLESRTISIPLGVLTGTQLFSNRGPRIRASVLPAGTVKVNVRDSFEPAGINQTRHSIWLDFDTEVKIVVPTMSAVAAVATQVPLTESIIVGEVPATFVSIPEGLFSGVQK
ncbi:MAG: sporulation protein YunB [Desulfotomaculales bacterium]